MAMAMTIATAKFTWVLWLTVTLLKLGQAEDVMNNPETASTSFPIHGWVSVCLAIDAFFSFILRGRPQTTKRTLQVKNVYRSCNYYGLRGNYVSDIALLRLQDPFALSSIRLPACLDISRFTQKILEPGASGSVAGFGKTNTGEPGKVLRALELHYIPYNQCGKSSNSGYTDVFISSDKFCAGFTNGSAVCDADSGGGLVFEKDNLWYVLGIVSVGLEVDFENGERTCDSHSYPLYTKVVQHIDWIQEVMFEVQTKGFYKSCDNDG